MKNKVIEGIICAAVGMVAATMPVQASEAPAAADVVYTTTYVNARTDSKVSKDTYAFTLEPNEELVRLYDGEVWDLVQINGETYFIYDKYLSSQPVTIKSNCYYSAKDFKRMGVFNWDGWKWTWYSQRILPGGALNIPGRHVDVSGYICDENERIVLACESLTKGTIVQTPLGKEGVVLDSCPTSGVIDVYVSW